MNNKTRSKGSDAARPWLTKKKVLCVALLVLAAGYVLAQPTLERWLGVELPSLVDRGEEKDKDDSGPADNGAARAGQPTNPNTADRNSGGKSAGGFALEEVGRDRYRSPAGLVYTMGPRREHRIDHVMRHTRDDSGRPVHGVFDATSQDEVFKLLDEAWQLVQSNARGVRRQQEGDRTELTIDMPQRVGYVGGQQGARQGKPTTKRLKLIVEDDRVITAYPTWPPRR
ncbi:MAG: hypothetical protein ACR2NP_15360 [Pirellulaceae bacterium]